MSRRLIVILTLCVLVIAAVAVYPWTLSSTGPAQMLARQLNKEYGLDVEIHGRSTLSLLPRPRLKVEGVEIRGIDGRLSISRATLRGHVGWFGLLRGQVELSDIALRDASASLDIRGADESFWAQWAAWLQLRSSSSPIRQVLISNGSFRILRDKRPEITFSDIRSTISWPGNIAPLSLAGSLRWNGQTITVSSASIQPMVLLSGKSGSFALDIAALDSRFTASGTIQMDRARNVTLEGKSAFSSKSLRRLTEWASLPVPLSPVVESITLDGAFNTTRNLLSWPAVQITLDKNKFEGSLAFRFDNNGNMVSGTLATDALDLTGYLSPLAPFAGTGTDLSYRGINRGDLDLRLSAASATLGPLKMADLALGLIVKPDRLEASLSRASIDSGTIKGRFLMTGPVSDKEIRLQGNIDNIDIARFLPAPADGQASLSGLSRGQLTLEGRGADLQAMLKSSRGKMTLSVTNGEIRGFDLPALLHSDIKEPQTVTPGATRSTFTNANLTVIVEAGQAKVGESSIQGKNWQAELFGHIALSDRRLLGHIQLASDGTNTPATLSISNTLSEPKFILFPGKPTDPPAERSEPQ